MKAIHPTRQRKVHDDSFFVNVAPTKLTESRCVKLHTEGWGIITDYYLESVKINKYKPGVVTSTATLKIGDRSGQITCIVKGHSIGLLFGLKLEEWADIEKLCKCGQQLFYRYFKDGLSKNFRCEEKLFYNFCKSNQKVDALVAIFQRCVNKRSKDTSDAFLHILELRKCSNSLLNLYISHLHQSVDTM